MSRQYRLLKSGEVKTPTPQKCKASLTSRELDVAQLDIYVRASAPGGYLARPDIMLIIKTLKPYKGVVHVQDPPVRLS